MKYCPRPCGGRILSCPADAAEDFIIYTCVRCDRTWQQRKRLGGDMATLLKTLKDADYGVDIDVSQWCGRSNDASYVYKIARINGIKISTSLVKGCMIAVKHLDIKV